MKHTSLPEFIAVDGEGRNLAGIGSEHLYTLLASSAGNWVDNPTRGLNTSRCLEFLLDLKIKHSSAVFVGFAINYDVNMMLGNLPHSLITELWQKGRCYWYDHGTDREYTLQYIPSKWFDVTWFEKSDGTSRTVAHIRLWDVWGFFQSSFVKALREWLPESEQLITSIEEMKEQRGEFSLAMHADICAYCVAECRLLVSLMDKLAQALWDAGLPLAHWHGAGAIAGKMLRQHKVKEHVRTWDTWPKEIQDACLWAYFGGRVEIFQQGIIPGPVYDYDIRSAYPDRIALLPSLVDAEWWFYDAADLHDILIEDGNFITDALIHCTWDTRAHKDAWLAPFPQHFESGRVAWEPVGEGWYHLEEWREAKLIFGGCVKELGALILNVSQTRPKPAPFSFIHEMYERKAAYKTAGDPRYYPLKIGLNALYGKLAQSMTRNSGWGQPPYQNYYLAGKITAGVRARMLRALQQCGPRYAVMVATDGLFTRKKMPRCRLGEKIGNWELSTAPDGMTLVQAGVFWEPGDEKARRRTRGFGVKSVSYAEASALFRGGESVHQYTETRFVGMGYCVNTGDWVDWRHWIEVDRKLSRDMAPHHITYPTQYTAEQWTFVDHGILHEPSKRRPYLAKSERTTAPDSEQLDAIIAAEQPQGAGQ